jgi:outer membrane protein insertion porin family
MRRIGIVVLLSLSAATTLIAQEANNSEQENSQLIERVIIRGNRRIPEKTIKLFIPTRKGDYYSAEQLDQAVRALFNTRHFSDVKVYVEGGVRGGKIVTFEVAERPLIQEIAYEGIDEATQEEARKEWRKQNIDLSEGSEYDPVSVRRAAAVIQALVVKRGNQQAKVIPMVEQRTATGVAIVFKIEE